MLRWVAYTAVSLFVLLAAAAGVAWAFGGRYDLGPWAAGRLSASLGRPVALGSLHVQPGRWLRVAVRDARVANLPGGTVPDMAAVARLDFEVDVLSLLNGPIVLRAVAAEGATATLEKVAGVRNWRFGPPPPPGPPDRSGIPVVLDARVAGTLTYRTTGSKALVVQLDKGTVRMEPGRVGVVGDGSYNGTPLALDVEGGAPEALRGSAPYTAAITLQSGEATLRFSGTLTDPLGLDGAVGTLALRAPTADALLQVAGLEGAGPGLELSGPFTHQGGLWRLSDAAGLLDATTLAAVTLGLQEGADGGADQVEVAAMLGTLDLNELLSSQEGGGGADVDLSVDRAPDLLLSVRLQAARVRYGAFDVADARFTAALTPGRVAVEELSLAGWGGRVTAAGRVEATGGEGTGGRVTAEVSIDRLDVAALRRALGINQVALTGRMDGHVAVDARGATLNAAAHGARVSAVVTMAGGSIGRKVVELGSLDARSLWRSAEGAVAVSCLLGAVDMRAGVGTVSPLRVRSAAGTVAAAGRFDLHRRSLDLLVASESGTTSVWALDVPVRVSGSLADPDVSPARWSAAGRSLLAAGDDPGRLLPSLRAYARRSPCLGRRG